MFVYLIKFNATINNTTVINNSCLMLCKSKFKIIYTNIVIDPIEIYLKFNDLFYQNYDILIF